MRLVTVGIGSPAHGLAVQPYLHHRLARQPVARPTVTGVLGGQVGQPATDRRVERACASASVHTRHIVEPLGRPAGITPARKYRSVTMPSGTSATHPAIAVYPFIPATVAAAANASTTPAR
jgi:hypothetical protein